LTTGLAGAVAGAVEVGEGLVDPGQLQPRLGGQRDDLGPFVGRRPLGIVLVVGRLEIGGVDHLVEGPLQRRQPTPGPSLLGHQQLAERRYLTVVERLSHSICLSGRPLASSLSSSPVAAGSDGSSAPAGSDSSDEPHAQGKPAEAMA
jgi:hypothetical protein